MDIDGDGVKDILSGSYSRMKGGMAGLFQVLHGNGKGEFKAATTLKGTDDEPLIIPIAGREQQTENICTRPTAADWNGDGHLDLVVGNFAGSFYVFSGEGQGRFNPKPEKIEVDGKPLRINGVHSDPFVVDWDRDGDLDIVSGSSSGGVQWAENVAPKGESPKLAAFKPLIKPGRQIAYGAIISESEIDGPTTSTRVWVDDVNEDGKWDILVGDSVTLTTPAPGLSKEEVSKKLVEWRQDVHKASQEMRAAGTDPEARKAAIAAYQKVYARKVKILDEQRTGFVWLYLQK